jgi:hypothetical protein
MRLFDYLIFNTTGTCAMSSSPGLACGIDNSIAFHAFVRPSVRCTDFRVVLDRLRRLDARALDPLGRYLDPDEIAALVARRERVLQRADEVVAAEGAAALFDW